MYMGLDERARHRDGWNCKTMTKKTEKYLELCKIDGTLEERRELLHKMTNKELDLLIAQAGNQTARIYYAGFKKKSD